MHEDWPETGPVDDARWDAARADLFSAHEELVAALGRFPASGFRSESAESVTLRSGRESPIER